MRETPLSIEGIDESIYAGFWLRVGANVLDALIILPWTFLILYINSFEVDTYHSTVVPSFLFSLWYGVYLVAIYGGTPGKLIVGIKIISISGEPISWVQALLRNLVSLLIAIFGIIVMFISIEKADDSIYESLSWFAKSKYLLMLSPFLFKIHTWINNTWVVGELIVLLTNKRKRALHDFIAGTVIIRSKYEKAIRDHVQNTEG